MSFLPKLSPEDFEDLFKLFTAAIYQVGISPKEARGLQIQLREGLQKIWDTTDPKPFPLVFDDFRQGVMEQFLDRLSKRDPDYRRHRF
jgi:hypothetical protein